MRVLAIDIGGKTRNGFCLMEDKKVVRYSYIVYDKKSTPLEHRKKILNEVISYTSGNSNVDFIIFERINLYRGHGVSPLANILSLCRLQTTIIDYLSNVIDIYDVAVKAWKSRTLGNGSATKEDSIKFVSQRYPYIDIGTDDNMNHDLCDAVCIAYAACNYPDMPKNRLNFT